MARHTNDPDIAQLSARWQALLCPYATNAYIQQGFATLWASYAQTARHYHTLAHISACLHALDQVSQEIEDHFCIEVALWLHDIIYDPHRSNNEIKSAEFAQQFLANTRIPPVQIGKIKALILLTQHPAHPSTEDEKYLLDIDLMILGAPPALYDRYEQWIRMEYAFVPRFLYSRGRKKILNAFLAQTALFQTPFFFARYEAQARENLRQAIGRL